MNDSFVVMYTSFESFIENIALQTMYRLFLDRGQNAWNLIEIFGFLKEYPENMNHSCRHLEDEMREISDFCRILSNSVESLQNPYDL